MRSLRLSLHFKKINSAWNKRISISTLSENYSKPCPSWGCPLARKRKKRKLKQWRPRRSSMMRTESSPSVRILRPPLVISARTHAGASLQHNLETTLLSIPRKEKVSSWLEWKIYQKMTMIEGLL